MNCLRVVGLMVLNFWSFLINLIINPIGTSTGFTFWSRQLNFLFYNFIIFGESFHLLVLVFVVKALIFRGGVCLFGKLWSFVLVVFCIIEICIFFSWCRIVTLFLRWLGILCRGLLDFIFLDIRSVQIRLWAV